MAVLRIIAVAVGADNNEMTIKSRRDLRELKRLKVRPYLRGLVQGLQARGKKLRTDYTIEFRQRKPTAMNNAAAFGTPVGANGDVIFCMSTTVVKAAADLFPPTAVPPIPIVGIVSDYHVETNTAGTRFDAIANVCGVSAQRTQTARQCFQRFLTAVPALTEVKVPARVAGDYGPSDRALADVTDEAAKRGITCTPLRFSNAQELETALAGLAARDPDKDDANTGVLILPIDICLAHAQEIIDLAQGEKKLPVFFPVPDWVKADASGALGAYGLSQRTCGQLMAERVSVVWRNGNAVPPAPFAKWVDASESAFDFVASSAVASPDELNIDVPDSVPRV